jgi:hypothetical protein
MQRPRRWPSLAVLCLAFALRAAAVILLGGREPGPDAIDDYLPISANLLAGNGFINGAGEPDSVRGPGYPLFLATVRGLASGDAVAAILWAQTLLDTITTWLAWRMGLRLFGAAAGLWSAALYAINPLSIYACALVGPEILFAFLLTAAVAALEVGIDSLQWKWFALCGASLGAAVLTRATPALLAPVWGAWIVAEPILRWSRGNTSARGNNSEAAHRASLPFLRSITHALVLGAASFAVVAPWTIRNWATFHEFIPVVANGGVNLYAGSSQRFWPPPPEHHRQRDLRMQELIDLGAVPPPPSGVGPAAGDRYRFHLGLANYRLAWAEDPAALAGYLAKKSLRLWYATQSGRLERWVGLINLAWLLLAVCGIVAATRLGRLRESAPCLLTIVYFPLVMTAMFPLARYVVGFAPFLCVMGSAACGILREMSRTRLQ